MPNKCYKLAKKIEDLSRKAQIKLALHESASVLWIDDLVVPEDRRRAGRGTAMVKLLEEYARCRSLKTVRLFAADEGDGPSDSFWDAVGYRYDVSDVDNYESNDEALRYMRKDLSGSACRFRNMR